MDREEDEVNPAFVCPISNQIFEDPVIADDGQTYERMYIEDWLRRNAISPKTREPMKIENLRPNDVIKKMIVEFHQCQSQFKELKKQNEKFVQKFQDQIKKVSKQNDFQQREVKIANNVNVESFTCPLTKKIFIEPVLCEDGVTYEKKAILKWFQTNETSPITEIKMKSKKVIPNYAIKGIIDLLQQQNQRQWSKITQQQRNFFQIFSPKIRQHYQNQKNQLKWKQARKIVQSWSKTQSKNEILLEFLDEEGSFQTQIFNRYQYLERQRQSLKVLNGMFKTIQILAQKEKKVKTEKKLSQTKRQNSNNSKLSKAINKEILMQIQEIESKAIQLSNYFLKRTNKKKFQIPQLCSEYIERKQIQDKIQSLFQNQKVVCLQGVSRYGKSQICVSYSMKCKFQQVIWLNCLSSSFIIHQIKIYLESFHQLKNLNECTQQSILNLFSKSVNESTLIVLDDARQKLIEGLKLTSTKAKILITSQKQNWKWSIIQVDHFIKDQLKETIKKLNDDSPNKDLINSNLHSFAMELLPRNLSIKRSQKIKNQILENTQRKSFLKFKNFFKMFFPTVQKIDKLRKQNNFTDQMLAFLGAQGYQLFSLSFVYQYFCLLDPQKKLSNTKKKKINQTLKCLEDNYIIYKPFQKDQQSYILKPSVYNIINHINIIDGTYYDNYHKMDQVNFQKLFHNVSQLYSKCLANNEDYRQEEQKRNLDQSIYLLRACYHLCGMQDDTQDQFQQNFMGAYKHLEARQEYYEQKGYYKLCIFVSYLTFSLVENFFEKSNPWTAYAYINFAGSLIRIREESKIISEYMVQSLRIMEEIKLSEHHPTYKIWTHLNEIPKTKTKTKKYPKSVGIKDHQKYKLYLREVEEKLREITKLFQKAEKIIKQDIANLEAIIILESIVKIGEEYEISQFALVPTYSILVVQYQKLKDYQKRNELLSKIIPLQTRERYKQIVQVQAEKNKNISQQLQGWPISCRILLLYHAHTSHAFNNYHLINQNRFGEYRSTFPCLLKQITIQQNIAAEQILKCWYPRQKIKPDLADLRERVIRQQMQKYKLVPDYMAKEGQQVRCLSQHQCILFSTDIFLIRKQFYSAGVVVQKLKIAKQTDGKIFQLPQLCPGFVENPELISVIQEQFKTQKAICISGLSGTGKSQFVISYIRSKNYQRIVWLNCFTFELMLFQIKLYLQTFHPLRSLAQKTNEQIILTFIETLEENSMLVLDDTKQQIVELLIENCKKPQILITSRFRGSKMVEHEMIQVLTKKIQQIQNETQLRHILSSIRQNQKQLLKKHKKIYNSQDEYVSSYFFTAQNKFKQCVKNVSHKNCINTIILDLFKMKSQSLIMSQIIDCIGYLQPFNVGDIRYLIKTMLGNPINSEELQQIEQLLIFLQKKFYISISSQEEQCILYKINPLVRQAIQAIHKAQETYDKNKFHVQFFMMKFLFQYFTQTIKNQKYQNKEQTENLNQQIKKFLPFFHLILANILVNQTNNQQQNRRLIDFLNKQIKFYEEKKYYKLDLMTNTIFFVSTSEKDDKQNLALSIARNARLFILFSQFEQANKWLKQYSQSSIDLPEDHSTSRYWRHLNKIVKNYLQQNIKYPKEIDIRDQHNYDLFQKKMRQEMQKAEEGESKAKQLLNQNKDITKAIELLYRKILTLNKYQGEEDVRFTRTLYHLACAYAKLDKNQKANDLFLKITNIHEKKKLPENPKHHSDWLMLAECYQKIGKTSQAENVIVQVEEILKHPEQKDQQPGVKKTQTQKNQ